MSNDSTRAPRAEPSSPVDRIHAALVALITGGLRPGARLPSTRALVERHRASPITVQRALTRLAQEGLVVTRPGAGAFVAERREKPPETDHGWQAVVLGASAPTLEAFHEVYAPPGPAVIPLGSGYLDPDAQPAAALAAAMTRAARRPGAWDRVPAEGLEALRAWFARQLGNARASDVLIVPGGQNALSTVFRCVAAPGAPVLVESPAHLGTLAAVRAAGLRPIPVPTDEHGVRPELLEAAFRASGARVLSVQPTYANPTGTTLPPERRRAVLDLARRFGAFVVEDDAARDLAIDGVPPPPLVAEDADGHVVSIRSLTKPAAPGLRVAGVCARGPVSRRLVALRVVDDLFVAGALQEAALELVTSPAWTRHLNRLRATLRARRDAAVEAVRTRLPRARLAVVPAGGLFLWLQLPDGVDDVAFARACADRGVQVNPGRAWFPAEPEGAFLRLSYAAAAPDAIRAGVARMGAVRDASVPAGARRRR
jgi:DNA-binding transcriptional MocR family regulator